MWKVWLTALGPAVALPFLIAAVGAGGIMRKRLRVAASFFFFSASILAARSSSCSLALARLASRAWISSSVTPSSVGFGRGESPRIVSDLLLLEEEEEVSSLDLVGLVDLSLS